VGRPRALLGLLGVKEPVATAAHFLGVWGAALATLPGLKIAPPPTEWGRGQLALDAVHHLVFAGTTSAVYTFVDRRSERAQLTPA
jgi:hypothetical protein